MPHSTQIGTVLSCLPLGRFLMTGDYDGLRAGAIVERAMACSFEPPCVCVALYKGQRVSPIVRDSSAFGLMMLEGDSKLVLRKFGVDGETNAAAPRGIPDADPFDAFEVVTLVTGAPILAKSAAALDCEVIRHFDFDGDHEMFVGRVVACRPSSVA